MNVSALDFHREEDDDTYFDCLEDRLAYLLQLTIEEQEEYLGEA
jgi:hypothetical protein